MQPIKKNLRLRLIFTVVAVGLAGCSHRPASFAQSKPASNAGEIGSKLPVFAVTDLSGRPLSSTELQGKVALVDFWATWCQPCKKEMPGYQELLDRYSSRGFAVVGFKATMMMDTEPPLVFARGVGVRYPLAIASPTIADEFGGIEGLPTTLIYDRGGILREKIIGFEYTDVIESKVKALLGAD